MTAELLPVRPVAVGDRAARLAAAFCEGRRSPHTRAAYARDLAAWLAWCHSAGLDPLATVRPAHVLLWLRTLDDQRQSSATRARRLAATGSWYRWLLREQVVTTNPCDLDAAERPQVNRDHSTTAVLSAGEAEALLAAADADTPRSAALVWLLLYGGLRVGELLAATVDDIRLDRGHPVLGVTGKGRKARTVPLPPAVFARLDAYQATRADLQADRLPTQAGHAREPRPLIATATGRPVRPGEVWRTLRRLAHTAGLDQLAARMSAHSLRHTFATLLLDAGVPLRDVQDALGHADPRTTRRYDRASLNPDRHPAYLLAHVLNTTRTADPG